MLIQSIKICGNKLLGNTVEITLNPKYNHIECDDVAMRVVSEALGSFFHPETALKDQIWNRHEYEAGAYVEVKVRNHPKKLLGFYDSATLTLLRPINQAKIIIRDDQNTEYRFTVQKFLDTVSCSGICIPTVFKSNVGHVISWIGRGIIEDWTKLTTSELWQRILNGILCYERHNKIQDWMFITRQDGATRQIMLDRQKTHEKLQNYREIVTSYKNFAILYTRAEALRAIMEENDVQQYIIEKGQLGLQEAQLQEEILQLEKEIVYRDLLEDKCEQLMDTLNGLERLRLSFQNKDFGIVEPLPEDTNYKDFVQILLQKVMSYNETLKEYQKTSESCANAEVDIIHFNLLIDNEQSKITAINLFESEDRKSLEAYKKSFDALLTVLNDTLTLYVQNMTQSSEQLNVFLGENTLDKVIAKLQRAVTIMTNAKNDIKTVNDEISSCLTESRMLYAEMFTLEENIQESKSFITTSSDLPFSYIEGLVAVEKLLEELRAQKSPFYLKFVCLPVRETTWKDMSDNLFTLEVLMTFLLVVVRDKETAQELIRRLPGTNLKIINLNDFISREKEDLPIIRRVHHRDILTVDQLISSGRVKNLMKDLFGNVILRATSTEEKINAKLVKRTLYDGDNTFDTKEGVCGSGHVFTIASGVQKNILTYLNSSKELRGVKLKIEENEKRLMELVEKQRRVIYKTIAPVSCKRQSFEIHMDLLELDAKYIRQKNIQEVRVETVKQLIGWLRSNPEPWAELKEDAYGRIKELKEQIASLEVEYENLLEQKTEDNLRLLENMFHIFELEGELHTKYEYGRELLVDIDADFNEEIRNGLTGLTKVLEQCTDNVRNDFLQVKDLHTRKLLELTLMGGTGDTDQTLTRKRLALQQVASKLSIIESKLTRAKAGPITRNRVKQQLLLEFPTYDAQLQELTLVHQRLQKYEGFMSPKQIHLKIIAIKSVIHNYEKQMASMTYWPTGFLESVFIMQNKASSHAISSIFAHVSTLSSYILPRDVFLHLWFVTEEQNIQQIIDFTMVREIRYAIVNQHGPSNIKLQKELVIFFIIQGICRTFQTPFIVLDDILQKFDRQYWDMISTLLKALAEKQQIIVIKGFTGETWTERATPDKVIRIRAQNSPDSQVESSMELDERELYVAISSTLKNLSLT